MAVIDVAYLRLIDAIQPKSNMNNQRRKGYMVIHYTSHKTTYSRINNKVHDVNLKHIKPHMIVTVAPLISPMLKYSIVHNVIEFDHMWVKLNC